MTIATRLFTKLKGMRVGEDRLGNVYYTSKSGKRWVMYANKADASAVCPEWHAWLHHTADQPVKVDPAKHWIAEHHANLTGSDNAYMPPACKHDQPNTPAYSPWRPGTAQQDTP